MSWKETCYIGDWSFLWERRFRGRDVLKLFSDISVNSFAKFDIGGYCVMANTDQSIVMNANERRSPTQPTIGRSFPTPLPNPLLLGHRAIRDDVAWRVLAGRVGLRHLFTPQTG